MESDSRKTQNASAEKEDKGSTRLKGAIKKKRASFESSPGGRRNTRSNSLANSRPSTRLSLKANAEDTDDAGDKHPELAYLDDQP
jgi:hypothetical protein